MKAGQAGVGGFEVAAKQSSIFVVLLPGSLSNRLPLYRVPSVIDNADSPEVVVEKIWQLVAHIAWQKSKRTVESLRRIGIKDVQASVRILEGRGVEFVDSSKLYPDDRGALTRNDMGGLAFELVHVSE